MPAKYVFSREFPATPDRMVPLETREPTLTLSEHRRLMDAAVAGARTEAFMQGRLEGEADSSARLAAALEQVSARLEILAATSLSSRSRIEEAIRFAHAFARKLAGRVLDAAPMGQSRTRPAPSSMICAASRMSPSASRPSWSTPPRSGSRSSAASAASRVA